MHAPLNVFVDLEMLAAIGAGVPAATWATEFGAVVVLAYYPMTAPVLIYDRFESFGPAAAQPIAAVVVIVALALFAGLRWLNLRQASV